MAPACDVCGVSGSGLYAALVGFLVCYWCATCRPTAPNLDLVLLDANLRVRYCQLCGRTTHNRDMRGASVCPSCSNGTSHRVYDLCVVCGLVRHSWVNRRTGARTCAACATDGAHHERICTKCNVGYGSFCRVLFGRSVLLCRACVHASGGVAVRVRAPCTVQGCERHAYMAFVDDADGPGESRRYCGVHGREQPGAVVLPHMRCVATDEAGVRCGRGADKSRDGAHRLCGTHGSALNAFFEHVLLWIVAQAVDLGHLPNFVIHRQVPAVMGIYYLDAVFAWPDGVHVHVEVDEFAHQARRHHDAERQVAIVQAWVAAGFAAGTPTGTCRVFVEAVPDLAAVRVAFRAAVARAGGVVGERPHTTAGHMEALALATQADGFPAHASTADPAAAWIGTAALGHWLQCHLDARTPVGLALRRLVDDEVPRILTFAHMWAKTFAGAVRDRRDAHFPVFVYKAPDLVLQAYQAAFDLAPVSIYIP